jgi:hypothetical protein
MHSGQIGQFGRKPAEVGFLSKLSVLSTDHGQPKAPLDHAADATECNLPENVAEAEIDPSAWRDVFEERAAIREYDGYDRLKPSGSPGAKMQNRWHMAHGDRPALAACTGCRSLISRRSTSPMPRAFRMPTGMLANQVRRALARRHHPLPRRDWAVRASRGTMTRGTAEAASAGNVAAGNAPASARCNVMSRGRMTDLVERFPELVEFATTAVRLRRASCRRSPVRAPRPPRTVIAGLRALIERMAGELEAARSRPHGRTRAAKLNSGVTIMSICALPKPTVMPGLHRRDRTTFGCSS